MLAQLPQFSEAARWSWHIEPAETGPPPRKAQDSRSVQMIQASNGTQGPCRNLAGTLRTHTRDFAIKCLLRDLGETYLKVIQELFEIYLGVILELLCIAQHKTLDPHTFVKVAVTPKDLAGTLQGPCRTLQEPCKNLAGTPSKNVRM